MSLNDFRATYPGLEVERATSSPIASQISHTQMKCEKPGAKKKAASKVAQNKS
jgi:hypothetical protein